MRILNALKSDVKFQLKQGFYAVYIVITLFYILVVGQLPKDIAKIAVPFAVFSDPSLVGFFFIGGIVMLEKVQGIIQYLVITPLTTREYLIAKVLSLAMLAEAAGLTIAFASQREGFNWVVLVIGIFLTSSFFTLYGFVAAAGCDTINQYFLKMVPYMMIIILPCFFFVNWNLPYQWVFNLFPSMAGLKLIYGSFHGLKALEAGIYIIYMILANIGALLIVERIFNSKIIFRGERP